MTFHILGTGTAVPSNLITQDDAARLAVELAGGADAHGTAIQALYRKTGVRKRHSTLITSSTNGQPATQSFFPIATHDCDMGPTTHQRMQRYEVAALDLATTAAKAALHDSETAADEISQLVTVSCTGFAAPGVDIGLVERLGLKRTVSRTHIGFMGCHGALNGLRVASAISHAAPGSKVLLCCVELCTVHHQYAANAQQTVANALFSDGAAAVVAASGDRSQSQWQIAEHFSFLLPDTAKLMSWHIGDHGFKMRLSPQVPGVIEQQLRPWLQEQLQRNSLSIDDIHGWAIHPGGPKILTATADALDLDHKFLDPSQHVLAEYGNMSSPTVLFVIDELRKRGHWLPCVAIAFGPGLSIEAALLR